MSGAQEVKCPTVAGSATKCWKTLAGQASFWSCSVTCVRLAKVTSRADLPICLATSVAPSSRGVSESSVPDMMRTGRLAGTSGGFFVIGVTGCTGDGQSRQAL
jgi:hypothetical protein